MYRVGDTCFISHPARAGHRLRCFPGGLGLRLRFWMIIQMFATRVAYVISRYLFPHSGPHHRPGSSDAG